MKKPQRGLEFYPDTHSHLTKAAIMALQDAAEGLAQLSLADEESGETVREKDIAFLYQITRRMEQRIARRHESREE